MAGLQKSKAKLPALKAKKVKEANEWKESASKDVAPKRAKSAGGKRSIIKSANKQKTEAPKEDAKAAHVPIVFVAAKPHDATEDEDSETDESVSTEAPKLPRLEPVPTDVPDPKLPVRLQKLLQPLIGYVYHGDKMSLKLSFEQAGLLLEPEYDEAKKLFRFVVNMKEVCRATGEKAEAHTEAREKLVQIIRYYCYTVKRVKEFHTRRKIFYTRPPNPPKQESSAKALKEENIGFQMLQRQGWSGGALGADEDGIIEPIGVKRRKGKSGLGTENATKDAPSGERPKKVRIPLEAFYLMMKQYAGVNALYDLVFSTQFTKQQVAKLKGYANSLKLFPQVLGHKKRLVVSRPLTIKQIKVGVMKGHSDLCAKYVVIPPAAGIPDEDKLIIEMKKEKED